jgi:hypothetical protein
MAIDCVCGYLLSADAQHDPRKLLLARHFVDAAAARVSGAAARIRNSRPADLDNLATVGQL